MLSSPRSRRKDLLEQITDCSVKEGLLRSQKRPKRVNYPQDRGVQLPKSRSIVREPEDPEHWHDGDGHLSDDDGDAYQATDDDHNENDSFLEGGEIRLEDEPHSREAEQRNSDQGWEVRREDLHASYVSNLVRNTEVVNTRRITIQSGVQAAIKAAASSCPCCFKSDWLTQQKTQGILWVGSSLRFDLEVPVQMYHGCGTQFSPKPRIRVLVIFRV